MSSHVVTKTGVAGYTLYNNTQGQLHRDDGPALITPEGTEYWYSGGNIHRSDGPAVIQKDGTRHWYQCNKLHRLEGPAIECADGSRSWYRKGRLHRLEGPAKVLADGTEHWYIDGRRLNPPQHAAYVFALTHDFPVFRTDRKQRERVSVGAVVLIDGRAFTLAVCDMQPEVP